MLSHVLKETENAATFLYNDTRHLITPVIYLKLSKVIYFLVAIDRLHMSSLVNAFGKNLMDAGLIVFWIRSKVNGQTVELVRVNLFLFYDQG